MHGQMCKSNPCLECKNLYRKKAVITAKVWFMLQKSKVRTTGSEIQLEVHKRDQTTKEDPWPRLTKDTTKYPWIKPDFDKMDISEDEDEEQLYKKQVGISYLS